nr:SprT family zinc-dependent metalloprotease [uncultured Pseudodesulfovibrio sp.]
MQTLTYGDERIRYQVCYVPSPLEKVAIHVHPDGAVQVDAPIDAALDQIKQAVQKRARWVMGHIENARKLRESVLPRQYVSGESHFYQGRRYQLKVVRIDGGQGGVKLTRGQLRVEAEDVSIDRVKKLLAGWYRAHAKKYFTRRMNLMAKRLPWVATPPRWRLLVMRKQWGSCSPKGIVSLNPHLIKAPRDCIEYVLLHELCHLQEHNHSPQYYQLLASQMPEWKSVKAKLDGLSEMLLNE